MRDIYKASAWLIIIVCHGLHRHLMMVLATVYDLCVCVCVCVCVCICLPLPSNQSFCRLIASYWMGGGDPARVTQEMKGVISKQIGYMI